MDDEQIQKQRKKSVVIIVIIIDILLLVMGVGFIMKANYVGGLVSILLAILAGVIAFIMWKTRVYVKNWGQ